MKRALFIIFLALITVFSYGCTKKEPDTVIFEGGFSFNTGIKCNDLSFSARVNYDGEDSCVLEFTDPEPLRGMEMTIQNSEVTVEYLGLKWESAAGVVPDSAVGEAVASAVDGIRDTSRLKFSISENYIVMKGGAGNKKFEIYLDEVTKNPVYAKIPGIGVEFSIEDFQTLE